MLFCQGDLPRRAGAENDLALAGTAAGLSQGGARHGAGGAQRRTVVIPFPGKGPGGIAHYGLCRVARDVEDGLQQLLAVAGDVGQRGVVVAAHRDIVVFGMDQAPHALEDLVDACQCRLHHAMRGEQALHQVLQAVGFLDDHLRVLFQRRAGEFAFQQLRRTADAAQRVLDLVGEVAHQFAVGLLLLGQLFFARGLQLLVDGTHLEQQARVAGDHRRDRAIDMQLNIVGQLDQDVVAGMAPVVLQRVVQRGDQLRRLAHQPLQGVPEHLARARGKQVLRRRIEVADDQFGVDQNDRRGQQVQPAEGAESFGGVHYG